MPAGRVCPRCGDEVASYAQKTEEPRASVEANTTQDEEEPSELDEQAWKAAVNDAGKVLEKSYKRHLYERYKAFSEDLARLLADKQIAYGNSFGRSCAVLAELFPNGITVEQYGDLLTITRIIDKLFRVANQKHYGGESPYKDIAGYAILAACDDEQGVASTPDNAGQEPVELT